ncbi:MAG: addiction module toxin RelE [Deltaproteobacteria bacterium]|nr:addiction module toxin RelE [Deltaproteobacteria bacterium]
MDGKKRFDLIYSPQVKMHLKTIERKYHSLIRHTIENQLTYHPEVETKNKKPLKRTVEPGAEWETRFGPDNRFRVYYEVDHENGQVFILAIGIKKGSRLMIGKEQITL